MNKRNSMSKGEFIFYNAFYALIASVWYNNVLYRCIPGCTLTVSKLIFWGCLLLLALLGVAQSFSFCRNGFSVFVNILTPLEVYTIIAFWKDITMLAIIAICLSLLFVVGYIVLLLSRRPQKPVRKKQIVRRKIKIGAYGARTISAFCMLVFFIPISVSALLGKTLVFKSTTAQIPSSSYECTVANNIEIVSNLRDDIWSTLNNSEKANTLQTIANIEAYYLGLPHELNLKVEMLGETTIAQYDDSTHTITLNVFYLDSLPAAEMLDAVCHESYHAYQHRLCDAYNTVAPEYRGLLTFHNVPAYAEEFNNYECGNNDIRGYFLQSCEITARQYAADGVDEYFNKIETYTLSNENKSNE